MDRTGVTLDRYYFSGRTYEPRYEHSYISDTGAKIQDALPGANFGFPEEPLRTWGEPYGLSN
jgi:hypothetical protein